MGRGEVQGSRKDEEFTAPPLGVRRYPEVVALAVVSEGRKEKAARKFGPCCLCSRGDDHILCAEGFGFRVKTALSTGMVGTRGHKAGRCEALKPRKERGGGFFITPYPQTVQVLHLTQKS